MYEKDKKKGRKKEGKDGCTRGRAGAKKKGRFP